MKQALESWGVLNDLPQKKTPVITIQDITVMGISGINITTSTTGEMKTPPVHKVDSQKLIYQFV